MLSFFLRILQNSIFKSELIVYTDGSHKAKWGSWAFIIVRRNKIIYEAFGRSRKTNSHRMEFQAAIEALKYIKLGEKVTLCTDSRVLIKSSENLFQLKAVNEDQLFELSQLCKDRRVSWKWVKAHAGHIFNERCDELCRQARGSSMFHRSLNN